MCQHWHAVFVCFKDRFVWRKKTAFKKVIHTKPLNEFYEVAVNTREPYFKTPYNLNVS